MQDKIWDTEYQEHQIRAIDKVAFFATDRRNILEIDGIVVKNIQSSTFLPFWSTIFVTHNFRGIDREIEVRFATKSFFMGGKACQIFIDGEQIGGDRSTTYPAPQKANRQIEQGFLHYFLFVSFPNYGLPYGGMSALGVAVGNIWAYYTFGIKAMTPIWILAILILPGTLLFSLLLSFNSWHQTKLIVKHHRRSDR